MQLRTWSLFGDVLVFIIVSDCADGCFVLDGETIVLTSMI